MTAPTRRRPRPVASPISECEHSADGANCEDCAVDAEDRAERLGELRAAARPGGENR